MFVHILCFFYCTGHDDFLQFYNSSWSCHLWFPPGYSKWAESREILAANAISTTIYMFLVWPTIPPLLFAALCIDCSYFESGATALRSNDLMIINIHRIRNIGSDLSTDAKWSAKLPSQSEDRICLRVRAICWEIPQFWQTLDLDAHSCTSDLNITWKYFQTVSIVHFVLVLFKQCYP